MLLLHQQPNLFRLNKMNTLQDIYTFLASDIIAEPIHDFAWNRLTLFSTFLETASNDDFSEQQIADLTAYLTTLRKGEIYSKAHARKIALWLLTLTKTPIVTQSELQKLGGEVIRSLKRYERAIKNTTTHQTLVTALLGKQWQKAYFQAVNDDTLPKRQDKLTGYIIYQVYEILYSEWKIEANAGTIRDILTKLNVDFRDNRIYEHLTPENRNKIKEKVEQDRRAAYLTASQQAIKYNTAIQTKQYKQTITTTEAIAKIKEILQQIDDPEIASSLIFAIDEALLNLGDIEI